MARSIINVGATDNDPSAETVASAFAKVNAMTLELFTANGLSGRQVIDLAGADSIRVAFQKWDTNSLAVYTALGVAGRVNINDGAFADDPSAQSIRSAFQAINTMTGTLYSAVGPAVYVATTGSDTTGTGAIGDPYKTIPKGISVISAGGTVYVRGGNYAALSYASTGPSGTSWTNAVRIAAYAGETVNIDGYITVLSTSGTRQYIIFDGLTIVGSATTIAADTAYSNDSANNHHIRFINGEIRDSPRTSVWIGSGAHHCEILNSHIHDGVSHGIYLAQGGSNLVEGNDIADNGRDDGSGRNHYGFQIYASEGSLTDNNIVRNNRIHGSVDRSGSAGFYITGINNAVYNNIIYGNNGAGEIGGGSNNRILNNTITGNGGSLSVNTGSGHVVRNNIFYNTGGLPTYHVPATNSNNITTNPLFVNAGANDYHVQEGSPAINAGMTIAEVATDADGVARPQRGTYDVGAYEKP